jgi:hypothetical protein
MYVVKNELFLSAINILEVIPLCKNNNLKKNLKYAEMKPPPQQKDNNEEGTNFIPCFK